MSRREQTPSGNDGRFVIPLARFQEKEGTEGRKGKEKKKTNRGNIDAGEREEIAKQSCG